MGFDPATLALAKKYADSQRLAYTETKEVEILADTPCQLAEWNQYLVDSLYPPLEEGNDYYLYVDGKEFKYRFNRHGDEWNETDSTDRRFGNYYTSILPREIDPVPETVTIRVIRVDTIVHPVEDKYIHNLPMRVSLLETGGVLLEKTVLPFEVQDGSEMGVVYAQNAQMVEAIANVLTTASRVKVSFDGVDYTCNIQSVDGGLYIGNSAMAGGTDTGEPFALYVAPAEGVLAMSAIGTEETHTVGITVDSGIPNYITEDKVLCYVELEGDDFSTYTCAETDPIPLVAGRSYLVMTSSGTYAAVCKSHNLGSIYYLGNAKYSNFTPSTIVDTGESFFVCSEPGYRAYFDDANKGTFCRVIAIDAGPSIIDPSRLVKTIDLDSYGIGAVIFNLVANGGGTETLTDMFNFWFDVSTVAMLRLTVAYNEYLQVEIDSCSRIKQGEATVCLSYNIMAPLGTDDVSPFKIDVAIVQSADGENNLSAIVTVKVT